MKAIVCTNYGPPDVLQIKDVEEPNPKDSKALSKAHAASLNADDPETLRGTWRVHFGGL
jgi:NADPH:quinone reductase-like Zn-dependent oxidoreductase